MKLLFWLAIIALGVLWLLRSGKSRSKPSAQSKGAAQHDAGEAMVQCAHCGVHVPASEALQNAAGLVFCSEEHRLLHR
jgi:uncharacterized protein